MLIVHLYVSYAHVNLCHFFSSSWCQVGCGFCLWLFLDFSVYLFVGHPQGTVLDPLLFSLYINDISSDTESEIRLFADDCVCYCEIKDEEEHA